MLAVVWRELNAHAGPPSNRRYGSYNNRCCRASNYYRRLFRSRNTQLRQCKRQTTALISKINGLKFALDAQQIVIKIVPPNLPPPSVAQLVATRNRAIRVLETITFGNTTTTATTTARPPPVVPADFPRDNNEEDFEDEFEDEDGQRKRRAVTRKYFYNMLIQ